jgi:hypothetical protein
VISGLLRCQRSGAHNSDRGTCSAERTAVTVVEVAVVGGLISAAVGFVVFIASPLTRFSVEP